MIKNMEDAPKAQGSNQVQNFVDNVAHVEAPRATLNDKSSALAPRVPFPTAYELTFDQEASLIEWADGRRMDMEREMDRVHTGDVNWFQAAASNGAIPGTSAWRTHFGKRYVYDLIYHNQLEWRPYLLGGIYGDSNFTIPIARRICTQMIARANNYFFATDPWCSAYPQGKNAKDLAVQIDRYQQHKFEKNKIKHTLENANKLAFIRGETVVKTTYDVNEQLYQQIATVLVDDKGHFIMGVDNDYILNTDIWVPAMETQVDPNTGAPMIDPTTQQPVPPTPSGGFVLKRDLTTPKPAVLKFVTQKVERRKTLFKGAKSDVVYYRDFLCPLTAPSVQEADIVCHLYDMPVMKLIDLYNRKAMIGENADEELETTKKAIDLIRTLSSSSGQPKSAAMQPRLELDENTAREIPATGNPMFEICECHARYDANGDGIMEDIVLVYAKESKVPIFYDYVANTTPDGERPYDVIRINEIDGRWYGLGAMEMFEKHQEAIDLFFNRWNFNESSNGKVIGFSPHNTVEGESNKDLHYNDGTTLTPKPGKTIKDVIEIVYLDDREKGDMCQKLMEFIIQVATNESGVANANDAASAGLDTSELATGVRNIEKSGQELFAPFLSTLEPGHTGVCRRNMNFNFMYMDDKDVYVFEEGDEQNADLLRREDVQSLEVDIDLLLTRYRGEQLLQSSGQAMQIAQIFYSFPFAVQQRVMGLAIDQLRALQVQNPEEIIVPTQAPAPMPGQKGAGGAPTPGGMPPPQAPISTTGTAAAAAATGESPPNL